MFWQQTMSGMFLSLSPGPIYSTPAKLEETLAHPLERQCCDNHLPYSVCLSLSAEADPQPRRSNVAQHRRM